MHTAETIRTTGKLIEAKKYSALYSLESVEYVVLSDDTVFTRDEDNRYGSKHAIFPYPVVIHPDPVINVGEIVANCWGKNTVVTKAMKLHALMDKWWRMQKHLCPCTKTIALLDQEIKLLL